MALIPPGDLDPGTAHRVVGVEHPEIDELTDDELTDDELSALAMAADPGQPLADDAIPLSTYLAGQPSPLPEWYMPPAMTRVGARWRIPVVAVVVGAFLLIEVLGLCSTFGQLSLP
jgi:hypothetical protein